jgi:hypothetical protein
LTVARTLLGKQSSFVGRSRTYLAPGALEVETVEVYRGTRRRVLFDEVTLVTLHRRRRIFWLVLSGSVAAIFGLSAIFAFDTVPPAVVFGIVAAIAALAFLHQARGIDVVTVFGKRGSTKMSFAFRKSRARQVFETICEEVRRVPPSAATSPSQI